MNTPDGSPKPPTAEELAVAFGGLPAAPATEVPADTAPKVRWLTDKKRIEQVELEYPFELAGVEYRVITIARMTAGAVRALMSKMRESPALAFRFPIYFVDGIELTDAAWDAMDDDDRLLLEEIASDFFPARFRTPQVTESA